MSERSGEPPDEPEERTQPSPARRAFGALRHSVVSATEPIVDRVNQAIDEAERSWQERPGARIRRVRRMGRTPLPYLMDLHPDARLARPVQVGVRTIDVKDIAGTAVGGGGAQRGGDFLPLRRFRGDNWVGRWQRLRRAQERLVVLPPIDVLEYASRFWVVDGHNRVALALYGGQVAIDANITELVLFGGRRTEAIIPHSASASESRSVRTAGSGHRPSDTLAEGSE